MVTPLLGPCLSQPEPSPSWLLIMIWPLWGQGESLKTQHFPSSDLILPRRSSPVVTSRNFPDNFSSHRPSFGASSTRNQELLGQGCSAHCLSSRSGIPNSVFLSALQIRSWWWPLKGAWRKPRPFTSHLRTRRVSCSVALGTCPCVSAAPGTLFLLGEGCQGEPWPWKKGWWSCWWWES